MQNLSHIWPTSADLARDLGLPYPTVSAWRARGIPARRFADIVRAARRRGVVLTMEELAGLAGDGAGGNGPGRGAADGEAA